MDVLVLRELPLAQQGEGLPGWVFKKDNLCIRLRKGRHTRWRQG